MEREVSRTAEDDHWYETWFDSPFYPLLYQNRDEREAEAFIRRLIGSLEPAPDARILDLACGRGRYSRFLAALGFEVVGMDLSPSSIHYARRYETDNLTFFTHDMRLPFRTNYFDFIFSFFTSFGYFPSERDDLRTLKSVAEGLRENGVFVLDFFNSRYVREKLTGKMEKEAGGIHFFIEKHVEAERIIKTIRFSHEGRDHQFRESVRLFTPEDFQRLFTQAGLHIRKTFGDYDLSDFHRTDSPRLILIAHKS